MNTTQLLIDFDPNTRRLVVSTSYLGAPLCRSFPSRRFDAKTKTWRMPLVRANIEHLSNLFAEKILTDTAQQAIRDFEKLSAAPKKVPFPLYNFSKSRAGFEPMPHQMEMLNMAWGLRSVAWFAKMGTGKTFASIHLACARFIAGQISTVVIICPVTLRNTWRKEWEKYATVPYVYAPVSTGKKFPYFPDNHLRVFAVSVEGLGSSETLFDMACGLYTSGPVLTIVDESSRIKNESAKRTKKTIALGPASAYRMILNGTPIAIGIQDLWAQYEFLDPNIIGSGDYWAFKTRYLVMGGFEHRQIIGNQNTTELMDLIRPYTMEVGKDVLGLPPKLYKEISVEITPEQRRYLLSVVKGHAVDEQNGFIKADNALEKLLRCRQIVGGWLPKALLSEGEAVGTELMPLTPNPKLEALMDLIDDNFKGSKFIIWTPFVHEIYAIEKALIDKYGAQSVGHYSGDVPGRMRNELEYRYCNDKELRFFIGNPQSAGLGLTLISGENDVMIYYSGTTAYIDRAQSEDRAHRIGQSNSVTVVDIIAEGTVDAVIAAAMAQKVDVETYVLRCMRNSPKDLEKMMLQS